MGSRVDWSHTVPLLRLPLVRLGSLEPDAEELSWITPAIRDAQHHRRYGTRYHLDAGERSPDPHERKVPARVVIVKEPHGLIHKRKI